MTAHVENACSDRNCDFVWYRFFYPALFVCQMVVVYHAHLSCCFSKASDGGHHTWMLAESVCILSFVELIWKKKFMQINHVCISIGTLNLGGKRLSTLFSPVLSC